jgi:hypothetical protein
MRVPDEYKDFIISCTGGNPFYLDVISQSVRDIVTAKTFRRISVDVLVQALERAIFNSKGCIFQYLNSSLETEIRQRKHCEIYISLLLAIANGSSRTKEISRAVKKRAADVSRRLAELVEMNILCKNGPIYSFVDRMFAFWFRLVYQKKRSAIVSYLPDRIDIFRKEAAGIVKCFMAEEEKDILSRVCGILGLFNNEKLSIAEKECRLPAFSSVDIEEFPDGSAYIRARTRKSHWILSASAEEVKDIDIIEFSERVKESGLKVQKKILIAPFGIEMNAHLMAKEERIWIIDQDALNQLMTLYGKDMIIRCRHPEKARVPR